MKRLWYTAHPCRLALLNVNRLKGVKLHHLNLCALLKVSRCRRRLLLKHVITAETSALHRLEGEQLNVLVDGDPKLVYLCEQGVPVLPLFKR